MQRSYVYGREIMCPKLRVKSASDLRDVGFGVEIPKQDDEGEHVDHEGILHPEGEVASRSNAVDPENQGSRELDQLEDRQVLLPPEIFTHRRA